MRILIALCVLTACENRLDFLRPMDETPASTTPTEVSSASIPLVEVEAGGSDTSEGGVLIGDAALEAAAPDAQDPLSTQVEVDSGEATPTFIEAGLEDSGTTSSDAASTSSVISEGTSKGDAALECPIPDILGSECNVDLNCGCIEGHTCRVANIQTGQTLCFEPGQRANYESCEADQDCLENSYCEQGLCHKRCDIPGAFCVDDSWCGPMVEGGRNVCQGHCNVMPYAINHNDEEFWVTLQEKLVERGLAEFGWDRPYVPCGEGGYCHTGIDPLRPYPHCVAAQDYRAEGESCAVSEDCSTGLACYESVCRIVAFTSDDCAEGYDVIHVEVDDPNQWRAPDGYNALQVCTPDP